MSSKLLSPTHQNPTLNSPLVCRHCKTPFSIDANQRSFLQRFDVPAPSLCPDCREQRRLSHINQLHLFKSSCAISKQPIITHYPSDSGLKVCSQQVWYSDLVDNTQFAREIDFSRPFFEQFAELDRAVYRPALFTDFARDENSAYTNYSGRNKNCYLIFDSDENWDCYYGYSINSSRNSVDCFRVENLELCYQATDCKSCYNCRFIWNSEGCSDSAFLNNCIGCKHCLLCSNLHQKEYYVMNNKVSKAEYEALWGQLGSRSTLDDLRQTFSQFRAKYPQKALRGFQNENVSGNYLVNCKNATLCWDSRSIWDGMYLYQVFMEAKDCCDCNEVGEGQLMYECTNFGYNAFNVRFCLQGLNQLSNMTYCRCCFNGCSDLFGCSGLKKKQYCILNKQYSKSDYETLVSKLIAHMHTTGEWGEFFPTELSDHEYNTSLAQDYFPLTKEDVLARGWRWREMDARDYAPQSYQLEDRISDCRDDLCSAVLACINCRKNFRITPQELSFYRNQNLPVPNLCFFCRHIERLATRTPRQLWSQPCAKCNSLIESALDPNLGHLVYCDQCYLDSLE